MNAPHKVAPERLMDGPMACETAHPVESRCPDHHLEVAFATLPVAGMAAMRLAIVMHGQFARREGLLEALVNFRGNTHFSAIPSFSSRGNG